VADRWGYIDKQSKLAINPQFEEAGDFSDGLAIVRIGDRYGYIDKSGKLAIQPQFDGAGEFSDGLALVSLGGKYGYVDKSGKLVINPQFETAGEFSDGLALAGMGKRFGYIDKQGKFAINPQFDRAGDFDAGILADAFHLVAVGFGLGSLFEIEQPAVPARDLYALVAKARRPFGDRRQAVERGCIACELRQKYRRTLHRGRHFPLLA
jgi:hypothetical protein